MPYGRASENAEEPPKPSVFHNALVKSTARECGALRTACRQTATGMLPVVFHALRYNVHRIRPILSGTAKNSAVLGVVPVRSQGGRDVVAVWSRCGPVMVVCLTRYTVGSRRILMQCSEHRKSAKMPNKPYKMKIFCIFLPNYLVMSEKSCTFACFFAVCPVSQVRT